MQTRKELGDVLVDEGLVSQAQLDFAEAEEAKTGKSAWKVLLERELVTERDLLRARAAQIGMRYVDLSQPLPSPQAASLVPEDVARRQLAIAVDVKDGVLTLAMADPRNHLAVGEVAQLTGMQVEPAVAYRQDLVETLDQFYGDSPQQAPQAAVQPPAPEKTRPAPAEAPSNPPETPDGMMSEDELLSPASAPSNGAAAEANGGPAAPGHAVQSFGPDDLPAMIEAAGQAPEAEPESDNEKEPNLADFLLAVLERKGSDLHLTAGLPPMIRLDGEIQAVEGYRRLMPKDLQEILYSMLTQKQRESFEEHLELDVSYSLPGKARFRVNVFQQRDAMGSVMRLIPYEIKTTEQLGLPPAVQEFANMRRGLVLVTGITGSGKSTTLAALVDYINSHRADHIMTVQDPIEFLHQHKRSVVNQREVGTDTYGFAEALKRVLRQDPDVILVGEMRDLETISTALTAAETGHLVFGTLHTQDAPQSVDRVIDVFPPHQQQQIRVQLAGTIAGVVSQQLIPLAAGKGRAVAAEVLVATPAVRNLVREGKTHQIYTSMQAGGKFGMQVMDQHLAELVKKGTVTYEMALERCHKTEEFNRLAGRG
ncbi:MAG: PilT/PilU family type 4a pilus ATPase [Actinobacteria bacterium]|nr:PilT/PilU family type 4a pilus ATPase [Actinomycetota bacterium]